MKAGAGAFQRTEVQSRVELNQQVLGGVLEKFGVQPLAEPVQQWLKMRIDEA